MNTRISDAAVEAVAPFFYQLLPLTEGLKERPSWVERGNSLKQDEARGIARVALEVALLHLQPAKPEAVRLRDELRERAAFENWAENQFVLTRKDAGYLSTLTTYSWEAWQAALASVQLSPEMDAGLYQWLKERDLLPDADEDGGIDMDAVIQALNEHERMLGVVPPSPAGQGDAPEIDKIQTLVSSILNTVSLGHQKGPYVYAGENFGRYLAEAARDCRTILRVLSALAARQPVGQVAEAYLVMAVKDGVAWEHRWYVPRWGDPDPSALHGTVYTILGREHPELGIHHVKAFYAQPPVQAVDLGQLKVEVQRLRKRTDPVLGKKVMHVRLDEVLALLDSGKAVQS